MSAFRCIPLSLCSLFPCELRRSSVSISLFPQRRRHRFLPFLLQRSRSFPRVSPIVAFSLTFFTYSRGFFLVSLLLSPHFEPLTSPVHLFPFFPFKSLPSRCPLSHKAHPLRRSLCRPLPTSPVRPLFRWQHRSRNDCFLVSLFLPACSCRAVYFNSRAPAKLSFGLPMRGEPRRSGRPRRRRPSCLCCCRGPAIRVHRSTFYFPIAPRNPLLRRRRAHRRTPSIMTDRAPGYTQTDTREARRGRRPAAKTHSPRPYTLSRLECRGKREKERKKKGERRKY